MTTAQHLCRYLETYRVPVRMGGVDRALPRRLFPVFRDREEFAASADLGAAIREALADSQALIVLCSPHAARSRWVDEEIRTFRAVGDATRIFPVLVDATAPDALPAALFEQPGARTPIELNAKRSAGRLRLVASLLGVTFAALQRHRRRRQIALLARAACTVAIAFAALAAFLVDQTRITEFAIPNGSTQADVVASPGSITVGTRGDVWFTIANTRFQGTVPGTGAIGRLSAQGKVTKYALGTSIPYAIASRPDGTTVFTAQEPGVVGTVTPAGLRMRHITDPGDIAITARGDVWIAEPSAIARTTGGSALREIRLPNGARTLDVTASRDGGVWYLSTLRARAFIGHIGPDWSRKELTLPRHADRVIEAADGTLWITEQTAHRIARLQPDGALTEFALPDAVKDPQDLAEGPDHAIWFVSSTNAVGRLTGDGRIAIYPIPTAASGPQRIALGPDGTLWFTEYFVGKIGRIHAGHWFFGI
jgi:virginiamycin B lyase